MTTFGSFLAILQFLKVFHNQRMLDPSSPSWDKNFYTNFFHLPPYWISIPKNCCLERILRLETWKFAWSLVLPLHILYKKLSMIRDQKCNFEHSIGYPKLPRIHVEYHINSGLYSALYLMTLLYLLVYAILRILSVDSHKSHDEYWVNLWSLQNGTFKDDQILDFLDHPNGQNYIVGSQ